MTFILNRTIFDVRKMWFDNKFIDFGIKNYESRTINWYVFSPKNFNFFSIIKEKSFEKFRCLSENNNFDKSKILYIHWLWHVDIFTRERKLDILLKELVIFSMMSVCLWILYSLIYYICKLFKIWHNSKIRHIKEMIV